MKFYSTNKKSVPVGLKEAVFRGLASDGGLYMPARIPRLPKKFIDGLHKLSFQEIAFEVARTLIGTDIPGKALKKIVANAINFDAPLVPLDDHTFVLELFHGPTLAFKDFGARFMAELVSWFARDSKKEVVILTATSGDTGSAVAQGFFGVPNVKVVVLYPKGRVTKVQESQMATLGKNIQAIEILGTFDDCQDLVKTAFLDKDLGQHLNLTSANSINIARVIPQMFYYFWAVAQAQKFMVYSSSGTSRKPASANHEPRTMNPPVFSVPSGNFGNLTAGLIAKKMGLPITRFIAATNVNDVVPEYLANGTFRPRPSKQTLSNAMDVGNPSNFARILDLYGRDRNKIQKDIYGCSFTDKETLAAITRVFRKYNYTLDPHGAVSFLGLEKYRREFGQDCVGVISETAHPAKFPEAVIKATGKKTKIPTRLKKFMKRKKRTVVLDNNFNDFKRFLAANY